MKKTLLFLAVTALVITAIEPKAFGRDAARDLKRMIGYTIVMADTVDKALESRDGSKFIKLSNGQTFKVDMLLLDPLPLTDVIIFAKPPTKEILEKFKDKLPERMLYSYKLLIDNEIYDATPQ